MQSIPKLLAGYDGHLWAKQPAGPADPLRIITQYVAGRSSSAVAPPVCTKVQQEATRLHSVQNASLMFACTSSHVQRATKHRDWLTSARMPLDSDVILYTDD